MAVCRKSSTHLTAYLRLIVVILSVYLYFLCLPLFILFRAIFSFWMVHVSMSCACI